MLAYAFKGHVDPSSKYSHLILHNVTIEMHGRYRCSMKTDLNQHEHEHQLVVISQAACRLDDWRVRSEPQQCRESFKLDCRHMFPRPVPSCGLWNSQTDRFIRALSLDISEENGPLKHNSSTNYHYDLQQQHHTNNKQASQVVQNYETYRIRYRDKFELLSSRVSNNNGNHSEQQLSGSHSSSIIRNMNEIPIPVGASSAIGRPDQADLLQLAGHLVFKCDIVIPDTSWRLSLSHKMFDYRDACMSNPLETIDWLRQNYSQSIRARLQEAAGPSQLSLLGSNTMPANYANVDLRLQAHHPNIYQTADDYEAHLNDENDASENANIQTEASGGEPVNDHHHHHHQTPPTHQLFAPDLTYQLTGPSSVGEPERNCWQKPRFGSLARLECANKRARFSGARLLECRPHGWVLLAESAPTTTKNSGQPDSLAARKLWPAARAHRSSRRVGAAAGGQPETQSNASRCKQGGDPDCDYEGNNDPERLDPADLGEQPAATRAQREMSANNDTSKQPQQEVIAFSSSDTSDNSGPDESAQTNPQTSDAGILLSPEDAYPDRELNGAAKLVSSKQGLSSAQLASLLPTCILPVISQPTRILTPPSIENKPNDTKQQGTNNKKPSVPINPADITTTDSFKTREPIRVIHGARQNTNEITDNRIDSIRVGGPLAPWPQSPDLTSARILESKITSKSKHQNQKQQTKSSATRRHNLPGNDNFYFYYLLPTLNMLFIIFSASFLTPQFAFSFVVNNQPIQ